MLDLYTNKDGNHYILHLDNQLVYRLYAYNGQLIRNTTIDNFSESPRLSRITGYVNNVYVIYKKGGYIYTKKSTDAGQNWSSNITPRVMAHSTSNGIDVYSDNAGVHMAWSEKYGQPNYYETNYSFLGHSQNYWGDYKQVSDFSDDKGGLPTIIASPGRVYVGYASRPTSDPWDSYSGETKLRIRDNGVWKNPELLEYSDFQINLAFTSTLLHKFRYTPGDAACSGGPDWYSIFSQHRNLQSNSGGFSYPETIIAQETSFSLEGRIDIAKTNNDNLHIIYRSGEYYPKYRSYDEGNGFSSAITRGDICTRISANSNDVYIGYISSGKLYLRQRDFAPLAPTNFAVSGDFGDNPIFTWSASKEADRNGYVIYQKANGQPYVQVGTTNQTTWTDVDVIIGPEIDNHTYMVKAKDKFNNYSPASNEVSFWGLRKNSGGHLSGPGAKNDKPNFYTLLQNYPNPFNPSTKIKFNLPEDGFVSLIVYDIKGKEISTLIDGFRKTGRYEVDFNGRDLSSGIYIYKMKTGKFMAIKRMLLLK